jgi:hypothetical protein
LIAALARAGRHLHSVRACRLANGRTTPQFTRTTDKLFPSHPSLALQSHTSTSSSLSAPYSYRQHFWCLVHLEPIQGSLQDYLIAPKQNVSPHVSQANQTLDQPNPTSGLPGNETSSPTISQEPTQTCALHPYYLRCLRFRSPRSKSRSLTNSRVGSRRHKPTYQPAYPR